MRDSFCEDFEILKAIERLMLSVLEVLRALLLWNLQDKGTYCSGFSLYLEITFLFFI